MRSLFYLTEVKAPLIDIHGVEDINLTKQGDIIISS